MSCLEGQRQRLRGRFNGSGPSAFEDYRPLEYQLICVVPRAGVNPVDRALLNRCRSLYDVLRKSGACAQHAVAAGANLRPSEYQPYRPSKALLWTKLITWIEGLGVAALHLTEDSLPFASLGEVSEGNLCSSSSPLH